MESNNLNSENHDNKNHDYKKMFLAGLMAFLGSFLAFYFLINQFLYHYLKPIPMDIIKEEQMLFNDFEKNAEKMFENSLEKTKDFKKKISAVSSAKYEDEYVIVVDLKPFDNDENNIRFNVKGNVVTVSGNVINNKKNKESRYYFTESFEIPEKIILSEITKEKVKDKYIITLPVRN